MRIGLMCLHTSPWESPGRGDAGGMNVVVRHSAIALAEAGHEVEVVTRRQRPDEPDETRVQPGLVLRTVTAGPVAHLGKAEHDATIEPFRHALERLGPWDVVHAHHWFSGVAALPVARERDIPLVQSFHSIAAAPGSALSEGERPESLARLHGERMLAADADAIVTVSQAEAATVVRRLGAARACVRVIPPGVDARMFHPRDPHAAGSAETFAPRVLVIGRVHEIKGIDLAIEAIAASRAAHPPHLVVVGEGADDQRQYADDLDDLIRRRGLGHRVHFVGALSREQLADQLARASAVLIPSHSETFGLVALEAAASGTPVISSGAGGLAEAVVDDVTGLTVTTRDPDDWARALDRVLGDAPLRERLSVHARRFAESAGWSTTAARLSALYAQLITERRREADDTARAC